MVEIGRNIRRIRINRDMNQRTLAKQCGISPQAISNYESGSNNPSMENVFKIAAVLKCKLGDINPALAKFDKNSESQHMPNMVAEYGEAYGKEPTDPMLREIGELWPKASDATKIEIMKLLMAEKYKTP